MQTQLPCLSCVQIAIADVISCVGESLQREEATRKDFACVRSSRGALKEQKGAKTAAEGSVRASREPQRRFSSVD
jgi:hypothetical protein